MSTPPTLPDIPTRHLPVPYLTACPTHPHSCLLFPEIASSMFRIVLPRLTVEMGLSATDMPWPAHLLHTPISMYPPRLPVLFVLVMYLTPSNTIFCWMYPMPRDFPKTHRGLRYRILFRIRQSFPVRFPTTAR